jgi:hypothetical protein
VFDGEGIDLDFNITGEDTDDGEDAADGRLNLAGVKTSFLSN